MSFSELLTAEFTKFAPLSALQINQLQAHYELLSRWNRKLNLTRISDLESAVRLHYCESLYAGLRLPPGPLRIADIGSGAGFPGFPIAVLRPDCRVCLVESHQRKAVFLSEVARPLPNIEVFPGRAEELTEEFDWLVSRAVTPSDVLELGMGLQRLLLIGEDDADSLGGGDPLPWGKGRNLVTVPRGTLPAK